MAIPDTPLGARVEMQAGGVWTDITRDTYTRDPISISRGRPDGATVADPSRCSVTLNNRDGKYSPRNPRSPYYGKIGRNTPLRVSVPAVEPCLDVPEGVAGRAATPHTAALGITGDIDVRVDLAPAQWAGGGIGYELMGKYVLTGNQRSWRFLVTSDGRLTFNWSSDGTAIMESRSPALRPSQRMAVRATLDVDNGLGGWTLTYYVADTIAGPWTQIGQTVTTAGIASIYNATSAPLEVGDISSVAFTNVGRRIYAAEVRAGIGGLLVAAPDFRTQTPGTTAFTDAAGRTWTISDEASISDRTYRFVGEVSSWPPRWRPSGRDVWVPIEGAGVLRRLGQGEKALDSTLRRRIPGRASLLAYWPCEDGTGATQAYSPLPGGSPLTVARWTFDQDNTLGGSASLPSIAPGGTMRGAVPAPVQPSTTWALCMPYRVVGTPPAAEQEMLSWQTTGTIRRWRITMGATGMHVLGFDGDGALVVNNAWTIGTDLFSNWWRLQFTAQQSGSTMVWALTWTKVGSGYSQVSGSVTGTVGQITTVDTRFGDGLPDIRIGHLTAWSADVIAPAYDSADHGFVGETASKRLLRLTTEEAATVRLTTHQDPIRTSEAMGAQSPATLLTLLRECADSDGGLLTESREDTALVYRERTTLYNQTPRMVIRYGDVEPDLEPVEDDQGTRNDRTVSRRGGSSARAVAAAGPLSVQPPPAGVGIYDDAVELSLATDEQTDRIAGWLLHLGTWDEARYPTIRLSLHKRPHLIPGLLDLELGDRIQITDLPPWLPPGPIDLLVQGISETLGVRTWAVELTCAPAGPWTLGVVGDPELGVVDTAGSQLTAPAAAAATTLSVATPAGLPWVTAAPNSLTDPGFEGGPGAWACTRGTAIGVVSWERDITRCGRGALRVTRVHPTDTGTLNIADTTAAGIIPAAAGQTWAGSAWVYSGGAAANAMRVALVWRTAAGAETFIYGPAPSVTAGYWQMLTVSGTLPAGAVSVRLGIEGRSAWTQGEWWLCDDVRLARTDTLAGPDMADQFPFAVQLGGEVVNVHGISGSSSPQTFYVDRARNGIVKSHAAGTDLRLAQPSRVAL
ncbi:hypothetical protein ACFVQ4_24930 [Streptomyces laurentii]|uniref:hypothetical protein n=1 Tax=Streptomyces laurentii TaxID=39478 RepID=UPI0036C691A5